MDALFDRLSLRKLLLWTCATFFWGCSAAPKPNYIDHRSDREETSRPPATRRVPREPTAQGLLQDQGLPHDNEADASQIDLVTLPKNRLVENASFFAADAEISQQTDALIALPAHKESQTPRASLGAKVVNDHLHFYAPESLISMTGGMAVGAVLANTNIDRKLHAQFQRDFRGDDTDAMYEFLHANKEWGNGYYTLPVFATAWAAGALLDESLMAQRTSEWGERCLRTFLVGAPPMLLSQRLTGASRPGETPGDSRWHPLRDSNGVSGHSFMGSLPFINAAKMTDNRWLKATLYAGSTLAPLSRVNDDAHYPTQAALGWGFAYLSATAIDKTEASSDSWRVYPGLSSGEPGVAWEYQY